MYAWKQSFAAFMLAWTGQLITLLGSGLTSFGIIFWLYDRTKAATPMSIGFLVGMNALTLQNAYALIFVSAVCDCFQSTAWQSALPSLVQKHQLSRANALNSVSTSLSALLSPALAGLLFIPLGLRGLVGINCLTYCITGIAFLLVRIPCIQAVEDKARKNTMLSDMLFGFRYMAARKGFLLLA